MASIIDGSFTSDGTAFNLALPSGYTEFRMVNITDAGSAAANTNVMRASGYSLLPAGYAYRNLKTNGAATLAIESMITADGFTFFDNSNPTVFARTAITAVTAASPCVITAAGHGLVVGDTVVLDSLNGTMQSMNGLYFTVDAINGNDFTITFDSSGMTPATTGGVRKVIPSYFSPSSVVIGPTSTINNGTRLLLRMNTVPSVSQGASQYSPFLRPYQPNAILRLYMPSGFGTNTSANFLTIRIDSITGAGVGGYALSNLLTCTILSSSPAGAVTTAAGLGALVYPAGAAGYAGQYPMVVDIAETVPTLSEAEDNTGIRGITIGTAVQTTGKVYQWWARKGYSI